MHLGATSVAFFATSTIKFLILEKLPTTPQTQKYRKSRGLVGGGKKIK